MIDFTKESFLNFVRDSLPGKKRLEFMRMMQDPAKVDVLERRAIVKYLIEALQERLNFNRMLEKSSSQITAINLWCRDAKTAHAIQKIARHIPEAGPHYDCTTECLVTCGLNCTDHMSYLLALHALALLYEHDHVENADELTLRLFNSPRGVAAPQVV